MGASDSEAEKSAHKEKKKLQALAPIAKPLAGKKLSKRTLKLVRKAAEHKCLKRGVKEVVKSIRRGNKGVCVIAGNITPIDVITHVPILCEEAEIPYVYVTSKEVSLLYCNHLVLSCTSVLMCKPQMKTEDLANAGSTKRPTCCVLVLPKPTKGEIAEEDQQKLKTEYDQVATEITSLAASMF
ncbi:putative 50S ribosomal protein L30e [Helianthus annuus]|nr:putative 50S ribosomal protein L30e [Helianthus annuus]KAJ0760666.1 putative 50S ribosomal protein L30e [Helianthus annuus]